MILAGRRSRRALFLVFSLLHTCRHLLFRAGINKNKSFMLFRGKIQSFPFRKYTFELYLGGVLFPVNV